MQGTKLARNIPMPRSTAGVAILLKFWRSKLLAVTDRILNKKTKSRYEFLAMLCASDHGFSKVFAALRHFQQASIKFQNTDVNGKGTSRIVRNGCGQK